MSKGRLAAILLLLLGLWAPPEARAAVELSGDFMFSGLTGPVSEISVRSRAALFFGGKLALGPVFHYEPHHSYLTDQIMGAGIRWGSSFVFGVDAGLLRRSFDGLSGSGYAVVLLPGYQFTKVFRVSVATYIKRIESGDLDARWMVDLFPFIGVRLTL